MISGSTKSDEAEEIASVISGSAFLVIEDFALDEESKIPPRDLSRLQEANRAPEVYG